METPQIKQLYRSRTNKVLAGICGGIGEYFQVDPILIRLITVMLSFCTGLLPGLIIYIIAYFLIPERPL